MNAWTAALCKLATTDLLFDDLAAGLVRRRARDPGNALAPEARAPRRSRESPPAPSNTHPTGPAPAPRPSRDAPSSFDWWEMLARQVLNALAVGGSTALAEMLTRDFDWRVPLITGGLVALAELRRFLSATLGGPKGGGQT